jgi:WD40 repeat protein
MKPLLLLALLFFTSWTKHNQSFILEDASSSILPLEALRNNSMDIEIGDLDGDGDKDLVIAMEFRPNVILLNDGKGKLEYTSIGRLPQKNFDSEDIALADFDKDGDLDIIFVAEDDQQHEYYINDGKANFTDATARFSFPSTCNAIDAADFDKDGDIDLVMGNAGQDFLLLNDGKGNFTDATKERLSQDQTVTQDVQSADIDKDGDLDLIMGNEDGNRIYLNDGKGFFIDATKERLPLVNEETRKVDIADIDKDGDWDLFFSNVDFRKGMNIANRILINNGKGFFTDETTKRYNAINDMHTGDISFADLDNDKDLDMVVANLFGGYLQVLLNDGKGYFSEVSNEVLATKVQGDAISVEVIDINNDGRLDVYIGIFRGTDKFFLNKAGNGN